MISAVSLNNDCHWGKESGIPFYLPKPLLIVSKNFRNIETATVGLTDSAPIPTGFDDQSKYADVNARTNFNFDTGTGTTTSTPSSTNTGTSSKSAPVMHSANGAPVTPFKAPQDGLGPDTFYTYHIVFVPDLTQKYGLRIRGGPGEIRAAMNLVNGWQYTGMGPYYSKDSSTAQNILSAGISARLAGQAAQDVLKGVSDLKGQTQSGGEFGADDSAIQKLSQTIQDLPKAEPMVIPGFAEIHVYEPSLGPDGMMTWNEIANCVFNREYLHAKTSEVTITPKAKNKPLPMGGGGGAGGGMTQSGGQFGTDDVAKSAVASVFGVPAGSAAIQSAGGSLKPVGGSLQSGGADTATKATTVPAGGVNQVNVTCGPDCKKSCCEPTTKNFSLFNFGPLFKRRIPEPARSRRRKVLVLPTDDANAVLKKQTISTPATAATTSTTAPSNDPGTSGPALESVGSGI